MICGDGFVNCSGRTQHMNAKHSIHPSLAHTNLPDTDRNRDEPLLEDDDLPADPPRINLHGPTAQTETHPFLNGQSL